MEQMVQGTDFDRKLDEYIEAELAKGRSEEEILKEAIRDMEMKKSEDMEEEGEGMDFDPTKLKIDPELFA